MKSGLIIKSISGDYTVYSEGNYICKPRGLFRHHDESPKVGDYVDFDEESLTITKIYPRKNDLVRPIIANVDKAFLVFSVKEPDLNLQLLDRMLSILEYYDIKAIIVFTKLDLLVDQTSFNVIKQYYESIGYKIFVSELGSCKEAIKAELPDAISVCVGQSGVGKSTLFNSLDSSLNIKTAEISKALGRGKHTTRHIELLRVNHGWFADSPGFGTIEFDDIDQLTLSHTFVEFFKLSLDCKFGKCTHTNEPGCQIKKAVEDGTILKSRYQNYLSFIEEIKKNKKNKY